MCVAVLPNDRVVSGSSDRTLRVWDVSTGTCRQTLDHASYVRRRRPVDATRRSLVDAATGAGSVRRRPAERPRRVRVARRHAQGVGRVEQRVPPDADRALRCRAAPASSRQHSTTTRRAQVLCVAALPNGHVVSGSADRTLMVWNVATGECRQIWRGHTESVRRRRPVKPRGRSLFDAARAQVTCVAVLSNGRVVSGSAYRTLMVSNVSTGECRQIWRGHTESLNYPSVRRRRPDEQKRRLLVDACEGRRSAASPSCRTATSCPYQRTTSSCGRMSSGRWHV